ncbi:MAG: bifunctional riboflavin kinase/FAD synthetase [Polyangiaceae bacterium]|nr:bifunctional riboflavin kinase/FAD synthetase [Polyangiaceae bacterium]
MKRAIAIGNFDGVHRGHRSVLEVTCGLAKERGSDPVVLTFDPHPGAVLGRKTPAVLTPLWRKQDLVLSLGIAECIVQRFDLDFAALTPEAFVRSLLVEGLGADLVLVGYDFRFGHKRQGDLATLRDLGARHGFAVQVHDQVADAGGPLSSTRVREAVAAGDLQQVRALTGRDPALSGVVQMGAQRGRTIGFPTANLGTPEEALPPNGVYAVVVDTVQSTRMSTVVTQLSAGVMNLGHRPTVGSDPQPTAEVHLFSVPPDADLYGERLLVHLVGKVRDEMKFPGLDALSAQIARDVVVAREMTETRTAAHGSYDRGQPFFEVKP